jgi:4-amino-4-deoxy-L-arabinose transferase-like glycosyltransferase
MVGIVFLIILAAYVVIVAEDKRRKLINLGLIVASMIAGFGLTLLIAFITGVTVEGPVAIAILCGYPGIAVAAALNYWRRGGIYKGKKRRGPASDKTVV